METVFLLPANFFTKKKIEAHTKTYSQTCSHKITNLSVQFLFNQVRLSLILNFSTVLLVLFVDRKSDLSTSSNICA